jgi:hypothetical protein
MHGLIHFMGFAKAFDYGEIKNITTLISKPAGFMWMSTAFLFLVTVVMFLFRQERWMYVAFAAAVISQVLIISVWKDAKWGTIANLLILVVAVFSFTTWLFEKKFKEDVIDYLKLNASENEVLVTEANLKSLPPPVQQYLRYSGVVGKPYPGNMYVRFQGEMRSREKDWFYFTSEQYNFFDEPTRLFFMKAKMFGITIPGCHRYEHQKAMMNIKLFGLFDIVKIQNKEITKGETVTVLNDMCLMAPASLLSKQLEWEAIGSLTAKVIFTNGAVTVSAVLYFNKNGQLIDFISNDRYDTNSQQTFPFSTPVSEYQPMHGMNLISYGEAIWHYNDTPFVYGKFNVKEIEYNRSTLK